MIIERKTVITFTEEEEIILEKARSIFLELLTKAYDQKIYGIAKKLCNDFEDLYRCPV